MKNKHEESMDIQIQKSLAALIELFERHIIADLYLAGANRNQIKSVVGVGTQKVDKIISNLKSLKRDKKDGPKELK